LNHHHPSRAFASQKKKERKCFFSLRITISRKTQLEQEQHQEEGQQQQQQQQREEQQEEVEQQPIALSLLL